MVVGNGTGYEFWLGCNVVVVQLNTHRRELILCTNIALKYEAHCVFFLCRTWEWLINIPVLHQSSVKVYKEVLLRNGDPDVLERSSLCWVVKE